MSKRLLFSVTTADCDEQHFTVGGHGGAGKDTSNTGVRFLHRASGAVGECREERSQKANRRKAWERLAAHQKFKAWHKLETAKRLGLPSIDDLVEAAMDPKNLRIESRISGKWTQTTGDELV